MQNGYLEAMRIFTKILNHPFAKYGNQGQVSVTFIGDFYLQREYHTGYSSSMFCMIKCIYFIH